MALVFGGRTSAQRWAQSSVSLSVLRWIFNAKVVDFQLHAPFGMHCTSQSDFSKWLWIRTICIWITFFLVSLWSVFSFDKGCSMHCEAAFVDRHPMQPLLSNLFSSFQPEILYVTDNSHPLFNGSTPGYHWQVEATTEVTKNGTSCRKWSIEALSLMTVVLGSCR